MQISLHPRTLLLCAGWAAALGLCLRAPAAPAISGRASMHCAVPVERRGSGLLCLSPEAAAALRAQAGDVLPAGEGNAVQGPPGRMAPARLLLLHVPIDVNSATEEELIALPGIGPALARRIEEARPVRDLDALARVPGIGPRRAAQLRPLIAPMTTINSGSGADPADCVKLSAQVPYGRR